MQWRQEPNMTGAMEDRIRVTLVGSPDDKAQLINALLGPEASASFSRPSDSVVLCWTHADEENLSVLFKWHEPREITGNAFHLGALQEYADAQYNPSNWKNVLGAQVSSPSFDLGNDVVLIDGPTVSATSDSSADLLDFEDYAASTDAWIYIDSEQRNSEKQQQQLLGVATAHQQPILVLQTTTQTQKSAEVPGSSDAAKVATRLWRARRMMSSAADSAQTVSVLPMLLKQMMQDRQESSGSEHNAAQCLRNVAAPYTVFVAHLRDIIDAHRVATNDASLSHDGDAAARVGSITVETPSSDALHAQLTEHEQYVDRRIQSIVGSFNMVSRLIQRQLGITDSGRRVGATRFKDGVLRKSDSRLQRIVRVTTSELVELEREHDRFARSIARALNLNPRMLQQPTALKYFGEGLTAPSTDTRAELQWRQNKSEQRGRTFDGEELCDTTMYPASADLAEYKRTRDTVLQKLARAARDMRIALDSWHERSFDVSMYRLRQALDTAAQDDQRDAPTREPSSSSMEQATESSSSHASARHESSTHDAAPVPSESIASADISDAARQRTHSISVLARRAVNAQHIATYHALEDSIDASRLPHVVLGGTREQVKNLLDAVGLSNSAVSVSHKSIEEFSPSGEGRTIVFLVDPIQLDRSEGEYDTVRQKLNERDRVIFVIPDFAALLASGYAGDNLRRIMQLSGDQPNSRVYLDHDNPLYSIAHLQLQLDPAYMKQPERLISDMREHYGEYLTPQAEIELAGITTSLAQIDPNTEDATAV